MYKYQYYKTLPTKISLYEFFSKKLKRIWIYDNKTKEIVETNVRLSKVDNLYVFKIFLPREIFGGNTFEVRLTQKQVHYSYCWMWREFFFATSYDEVYSKYLEYKDKKYST